MQVGRSKLLVGGQLPADPAFEQYWVRPGGATVLALAPDDRFTVIDVDGGQAAEVTALAPGGSDAAAAIGVRADAPATVLRALVSSAREGAQDVIQDLAGRGLDPTQTPQPGCSTSGLDPAPSSRSARTARSS